MSYYPQQFYSNQIQYNQIGFPNRQLRVPQNAVIQSFPNQHIEILGHHQNKSNLQKQLERQALSGRIILQEMYIGDDGAKILANFLQRFKQLQVLDLKANDITPRGFIYIFESLRNNYQLKTLNLEWNRLCTGTDLEGVQALYEFMVENRSVTYLDLRNNRINSQATQIIANMLRNNAILTSLDLRWNEIGNKGANSLISALQDNRTLVQIDLEGNSISEELIIQINNLIAANRDKYRVNARRIYSAKENNSIDLFNQSLNDRDYNFRSRQLNIQMENTNLQHQQLLDEQMNQHLYAQQHKRTLSNTINQRETTGSAGGIPYEEQNIIQHLENLIETERINSQELKNQLEKQINELEKSKQVQQLKKDQLTTQMQCAANDNASLRSDLQRIEKELIEFEQKKKMGQIKIEEDLLKVQQNVRDRDKQYQQEVIKLKENNLIELKNIDHEQQIRVDDLMQKIARLQSIIEDNRRQIFDIQEHYLSDDINCRQKAKDTVDGLKQKTRDEYQAKFFLQEARINSVITEKNQEEYKVKQFTDANKVNQRKCLEDFKTMYRQKVKLQLEKESINLGNIDFKNLQIKLKYQISNKEKIIKKLEDELHFLQDQISKHEGEEQEMKDQLKKDHEKEMRRVEKLYEDQLKRLQEIETKIKDINSSNSRLRQDYQRLSDLLQANLNKSVFQVFSDNNIL